MEESRIIIKPVVAQQFEHSMKHGRIFFLSAPCGFGKTVVAEELLRGRKVRRMQAEKPDFERAETDPDWKILLVDDLQLMQEEEQQRLCELIRKNTERRFVLLSRGVPPGCLLAFGYTGLMTVVDADGLLFDREDIRTLFRNRQVEVTDSEISAILKKSIGYPMGVELTAQLMAGGRSFTPGLVAQAYREVFRYFEAAVYRRFDLPIRRLLLEMAPFDRFDMEMARMVSGNPHVGELLEWLQSHTTMLRYDGIARFHFWPQFRKFLLWEMEREYTPEQCRSIYSRGGMYYELRDDYSHALECYTRSGEHSRVSNLLIRGAELHPGMGHYRKMEKYYKSLSEQELKSSPSLMQGMSMLCALSGDYGESERWYREIQQFAENCDRRDGAGRQARSRLAWLDISLPQRPVEGMLETIPAVFRLLTEKELTLSSFSVTSTLPSVMNGGKDFSDWSRKDDLLYRTMRLPVETVLGRDGVGLADCAIAESKFEKGEDISRRLLFLISHMGEIQRNGTPDMEFAVTGLLARSQVAAGQAEEARRTVEELKRRFADSGQTRFRANINALLCRIALYRGATEEADEWYRSSAPRSPLNFNVMKRYRYLTQAMVELAQNRPDAALLTLAPMEPYCKTCRRHIDSIHLHILQALAMYRQRDAGWREKLRQALDTAAEYSFVRTVSAYGAAVLPLLEELSYTGGGEEWRQKLLRDVLAQAAFYPLFLQPSLSLTTALTATELQILRLICADKSNAEIGEMMNIKISTVKTHVSHILGKLGVRRRAEAVTAAKKLWLV